VNKNVYIENVLTGSSIGTGWCSDALNPHVNLRLVADRHKPLHWSGENLLFYD